MDKSKHNTHSNRISSILKTEQINSTKSSILIKRKWQIYWLSSEMRSQQQTITVTKTHTRTQNNRKQTISKSHWCRDVYTNAVISTINTYPHSHPHPLPFENIENGTEKEICVAKYSLWKTTFQKNSAKCIWVVSSTKKKLYGKSECSVEKNK